MRALPVTISFSNRVRRLVWMVASALLFAPTPRTWFWWRRIVLTSFGAQLTNKAFVYPSARIWAPWNLVMADFAVLDHRVDCYNMAEVRLGDRAIVSRDAVLCTASHDHNSDNFQLVAAPIELAADAWVALGAYIGPGVRVGEGAVIGARAVVTRDVQARQVMVGSPARCTAQRRHGVRNRG